MNHQQEIFEIENRKAGNDLLQVHEFEKKLKEEDFI